MIAGSRRRGLMARERRAAPLRNNGGSVLEHGFLELPGLLDVNVCMRIVSTAALHGKRRPIINGTGTFLTSSTSDELMHAMRRSSAVSIIDMAMMEAFGASQWAVCDAEMLEYEPGARPQVPHADEQADHSLFAIVQLQCGQQPTLALPYEANVERPSRRVVICDACGADIPVTAEAERKRTHVWRYTCADVDGLQARCVGVSKRRRGALDDRRQLDGSLSFDGLWAARLRAAFGALLHPPHNLYNRLRPLGPPDPCTGDAILALPSLIHAGPGNASASEARRVVFLTIRPVFCDERDTAMDASDDSPTMYDPSLQLAPDHLAGLLHDLAPGSVTAAERRNVRASFARVGLLPDGALFDK